MVILQVNLKNVIFQSIKNNFIGDHTYCIKKTEDSIYRKLKKIHSI